MGVQLTGLAGLADCTTDNLDNPDAHDYAPGSVAHFGSDGGLGGCGIDLYQEVSQGAPPGQDQARGPPRARTPSVSTSMGPTTKTSAANWGRRSHKQMDSNLSQIATECHSIFFNSITNM